MAPALQWLQPLRNAVVTRIWLLCSIAQLLNLTCVAENIYALYSRPQACAYMQMPNRAGQVLPKLLSETGAFKDTRSLDPEQGLIPYDIIAPFWADGAAKERYISLPSEKKITFATTGEWIFPAGSVFLKTFELATNETRPSLKRRLETRLLVRDESGGVYGVTYKWLPDNSDAYLLATNLTEEVTIETRTGLRTQIWYYPGPRDCLICHTANAGYVLGVKTRQLNRDFVFPSGIRDNELRAWNHIGLFDTQLEEGSIKNLQTLARSDDTDRPLEDRVRSYLDANCSYCHRPKGTVAFFDARYDTPLAEQGLVSGRVLIDERIDKARVVAPNDIWRSILFLRVNTVEAFKMPPLARNTIDESGANLLRQWIVSLLGQPVLAPPEIFPNGGNFEKSVEIILKSVPGATIRYTLDGTVPTPSDLLYQKAIRLNGSTILRARAFKTGYEESITVQQIFIIGR
jgi:uncharacterized repeat protein (TIGR03806 family)